MAVFKCISCGAQKECEEPCSCPVCGYRMFITPYDRREKIVSEIEAFLSRLEVKSVIREDLTFEGKDKDDARFPSFDRVLKYVSGRERTEDFMSNLLETVEQLKLHYTAPFSGTYRVSYEKLDDILAQYDDVLRAAARILKPGMTAEFPPAAWESATLLYAEEQNKYLWLSAEELLDLTEALAKKIAGFIKANNLYGTAHQYYPAGRAEKYTDQTDYKDELEDAIDLTGAILKKRYFVDIMDDGSDELKEMLRRLWFNVELIMSAPLFVKRYGYSTESGNISEEEMFLRISDVLQRRYQDFDLSLDLQSVLRSKSEDELFGLYKNLIGIDRFGFLVPRGSMLKDIGESEKKLNDMIGLSGIKESIKKIKAYALANKGGEDLNVHMCFLGNPGSGKTEVARCIAGILYENGILPTDHVVEVDRSGLVSQYFGATAEKTRRVIESAMGGVLFIDEAYALGNNSEHDHIMDYGKEAIDTLVKAMEDHRGEFCVIFAGYRNETLQMLAANPGLKSRIQFTLDFPNYSREELKRIAEGMLLKRG